MEGLSEAKEFVCRLFSFFAFHCDPLAIENFIEKPSFWTYFWLIYMSTPWFMYVYPVFCWVSFLSYIFWNRNRLKGFGTFVVHRNIFSLRQMYCVIEHCFLHPFALFSNLKLIWTTAYTLTRDDLEILSRLLNVRLYKTQKCSQNGCGVLFSGNRKCIQCRIDGGRKARLKRIYTLLMMHKEQGNVWESIPKDILKLFVQKYLD